MFATLTPAQRALLRDLAQHVAQSCEDLAPVTQTFDPEDVRAFVWGAVQLDTPSASSAYTSAVCTNVLDYLRGGDFPEGATAMGIARRAAAVFLDKHTPTPDPACDRPANPDLQSAVAWRWWSPHGYQFTADLDDVPAHTPCEALFLNR